MSEIDDVIRALAAEAGLQVHEIDLAKLGLPPSPDEIADRVSEILDKLQERKSLWIGDDADARAARYMFDAFSNWMRFIETFPNDKTVMSRIMSEAIGEWDAAVRRILLRLDDIYQVRHLGEQNPLDEKHSGVKTQPPLHGRIGEPEDI